MPIRYLPEKDIDKLISILENIIKEQEYRGNGTEWEEQMITYLKQDTQHWTSPGLSFMNKEGKDIPDPGADWEKEHYQSDQDVYKALHTDHFGNHSELAALPGPNEDLHDYNHITPIGHKKGYTDCMCAECGTIESRYIMTLNQSQDTYLCVNCLKKNNMCEM